MKVTGTAVVAVAGIAVAVLGVYLVRKKLGQIAEIPGQVFNAVNNAIPPAITFDQLQPDGSVKKVTVTGEQIKKANANGSNMGMVGWSSLPVAWWSGLGYEMEDWEKDNPFGSEPAPDTKYSNPISNGVNWVGGAIAGDANWTLGGWIYDITH